MRRNDWVRAKAISQRDHLLATVVLAASLIALLNLWSFFTQP
jgi:hypothetical protein